MHLAIGSDHAGFPLKQAIIHYLQEQGIQFEDFGCYDQTRVDYPDYAYKVAKAISSKTHTPGIVICGTGIGVSIVANKVRGVRAALCCSEYMAEMARRHNDANILAMGGRTTTPEMAIRILNIFLNTDFEGGRHALRVEKITSLTDR